MIVNFKKTYPNLRKNTQRHNVEYLCNKAFLLILNHEICYHCLVILSRLGKRKQQLKMQIFQSNFLFKRQYMSGHDRGPCLSSRPQYKVISKATI